MADAKGEEAAKVKGQGQEGTNRRRPPPPPSTDSSDSELDIGCPQGEERDYGVLNDSFFSLAQGSGYNWMGEGVMSNVDVDLERGSIRFISDLHLTQLNKGGGGGGGGQLCDLENVDDDDEEEEGGGGEVGSSSESASEEEEGQGQREVTVTTTSSLKEEEEVVDSCSLKSCGWGGIEEGSLVSSLQASEEEDQEEEEEWEDAGRESSGPNCALSSPTSEEEEEEEKDSTLTGDDSGNDAEDEASPDPSIISLDQLFQKIGHVRKENRAMLGDVMDYLSLPLCPRHPPQPLRLPSPCPSQEKAKVKAAQVPAEEEENWEQESLDKQGQRSAGATVWNAKKNEEPDSDDSSIEFDPKDYPIPEDAKVKAVEMVWSMTMKGWEPPAELLEKARILDKESDLEYQMKRFNEARAARRKERRGMKNDIKLSQALAWIVARREERQRAAEEEEEEDGSQSEPNPFSTENDDILADETSN